MDPLSACSLESHHGPSESWPLTSRLFADGQDTEQRVSGHVIEAQYQTEFGILLVTSHDCAFEESCHFTLLGPDFRCLATAQIMQAHHSFLLNAHWPLGARTLLLHFYESLFFTLEIIPPGLLWWRPRLKLRRYRRWHSNADMLQSYNRLQAKLTTIEQSRNAAVSDTSDEDGR